MPVARCPYCDSETFSASLRADKVNARNPERFGQVEGHWFNMCADCNKWSAYQDGAQLALDDPDATPKKHSLPAVA